MVNTEMANAVQSQQPVSPQSGDSEVVPPSWFTAFPNDCVLQLSLSAETLSACPFDQPQTIEDDIEHGFYVVSSTSQSIDIATKSKVYSIGLVPEHISSSVAYQILKITELDGEIDRAWQGPYHVLVNVDPPMKVLIHPMLDIAPDLTAYLEDASSWLHMVGRDETTIYLQAGNYRLTIDRFVADGNKQLLVLSEVAKSSGGERLAESFSSICVLWIKQWPLQIPLEAIQAALPIYATADLIIKIVDNFSDDFFVGCEIEEEPLKCGALAQDLPAEKAILIYRPFRICVLIEGQLFTLSVHISYDEIDQSLALALEHLTPAEKTLNRLSRNKDLSPFGEAKFLLSDGDNASKDADTHNQAIRDVLKSVEQKLEANGFGRKASTTHSVGIPNEVVFQIRDTVRAYRFQLRHKHPKRDISLLTSIAEVLMSRQTSTDSQQTYCISRVTRPRPLGLEGILENSSEHKSARIEHKLGERYQFFTRLAKLWDMTEAAGTKDAAAKKVAGLVESAIVVAKEDLRALDEKKVSSRLVAKLSNTEYGILVAIEKPVHGFFFGNTAAKVIEHNSGLEADVTILASAGNQIVLGPAASETGATNPPTMSLIEPGMQISIHKHIGGELDIFRRNIERFQKNEHVAGDWETLAQLLIEPASLKQSAMENPCAPEDSKVYRRRGCRDDLNAEQTEAVFNATQSPHAFFIKGPPGTGKTEVICQIINLLTQRGERVLFASTANKPLDDVLDRSFGNYGVVPVRLSGTTESASGVGKSLLAKSVGKDIVASIRRNARSSRTSKSRDGISIIEEKLEELWGKTTGRQTKKPNDAKLLKFARAFRAEENLFATTIDGLAYRLENYHKPGVKSLHGLDDELAFDSLIIDEASRANDAEFATAAMRCKKWILVGDEMQLPPYVDSKLTTFFHAVSALYLLDKLPLAPKGEQWRLSRHHDRKQWWFDDGIAAQLADAVSLVLNLWLEEPRRSICNEDEVFDAAMALKCQGVYSDYNDVTKSSIRGEFAELAATYDGTSIPDEESSDRKRRHVNVLRKLQGEFTKYFVRSFFERGYTDNLQQDKSVKGSGGLTSALVTQYRMVPELARIVGGPVYKKQYATAPNTNADGKPRISPFKTISFPSPANFIDTSLYRYKATGQKIGTSWHNEFEANIVVDTVARLNAELKYERPPKVLILSFYKAQVELIRSKVHERFCFDGERCYAENIGKIQVENVDSAQGRQGDIVILSFVRAVASGLPDSDFGAFIQDINRLNVALSRARAGVIMIGHRTTLENLCTFEETMDFYQHLLSSDSGVSFLPAPAH